MPIAVTHGPSGANSCLATHSTACARPRAHQQRIPALRCHARDAPPTLELEGTSIGHPTLLHTAWWRFGHWLHTHYFHQQTLGGHNLPPGGLFVLASNHASHLDCSSVFTAAQRSGCEQTYALGARDYFFVNAFVRWFVTSLMNVIPFNRRGFTQRDVDALLQAQKLASHDHAIGVLMFPEGTRSVGGKVGPFKTGVAFLADKLDVPVVPTYVHGTRDAMPKHTYVPLPRQVTVVFGAPLRFQRPRDASQLKAAQQRFADDVRAAVVALQEQVAAEQSLVQRVGPAARALLDRCMVLVLHALAVAVRGLTGLVLGRRALVGIVNQ